MSDLNEISGFSKMMTYYEENKQKPWREWLKIKKIFKRPGKQGLLGLMTGTKDKEVEYVFKISQHINYLAEHELAVMLSLNKISRFCPHFCKVFGGIVCEVDPTKRKEGNPFDPAKYMIEKDVLLMEHLQDSYKLYNYITCDSISEDILFSIVKQTLLGISIAQKKCKFTHYDLHSNNIMIKKCSKNLVFLYILNENNQFCVPSHGYYPVVIDFGFSYSQGLDGGPMWPSLNYTDSGFMSDRFDPISDLKLFMITISDEIHAEKRSKNTKALKNIVKNIFGKLKVDWETGWDIDTGKCATDYPIIMLENYSKISNLFKEYEYYCFDFIQTLIVLPLQPYNYKNMHVSYSAFLKEFIKIEAELTHPFYCLYILKSIVDSARIVRADYSKKETREQAVGYFKNAVYECIDSVAKYCNPKNIHFERMLCSLLCFANCLEGILYKVMEKKMKRKLKIYEKLPIQTPEELCGIIDINIPSSYEFSGDTEIMVVDCIKETCDMVQINGEEAEKINGYESISWGPELYKIISKKNNYNKCVQEE